MKQLTTITAPNIIDVQQKLVATWRLIDGNEAKTIEEFYAFLASRTLMRDRFLFENTTVEFQHLKAAIILSNLIPR